MVFGKKRIYMDFASATPLHPRAMREVVRGLRLFGNPSAPHEEARAARRALEEARIKIARVLAVKPETLIVTGSGTEGNNLAVFGVIDALIRRGAKPEELHVIASGFEHPSLGDPITELARRGVAVSLAAPTAEGIITPEEIEKHLRPETVLVSVVAVQSEIGMIQPLKDIARVLEPHRQGRTQKAQELAPETAFPIFHTDASQGSLFVDLSPERLGVDLASYDAQKIMGPKGVGVLYRDLSVPLVPIMRGGRQERTLRPGTENVAAALGMAEAFVRAKEGRKERALRVLRVRDYFLELLETELPQVEVNGGVKHRIANNVNLSVPGTDGDYLAVLMDQKGIAVSPRSACINSGNPSGTVAALGKDEAAARATLRFTFAPSVTKKDAWQAVTALKEILKSTAVQNR